MCAGYRQLFRAYCGADNIRAVPICMVDHGTVCTTWHSMSSTMWSKCLLQPKFRFQFVIMPKERLHERCVACQETNDVDPFVSMKSTIIPKCFKYSQVPFMYLINGITLSCTSSLWRIEKNAPKAWWIISRSDDSFNGNN